jgi:D-beta-D-heptose 7-phosphate kinase/D-beta-D-heptose 1-phosphate adenosyltransferase
MPSLANFFRDAKSFWEAHPRLRPDAREAREVKLCFTNGCFDLLHPGHVQYLEDTKALGDFLVVGLNSDESVRRLKGPTRPLQDEAARALMLLGLRSVDAVLRFDEDTPLELIGQIRPDILAKGGDYAPEAVVGREVVEGRGGRVAIIPFLDGHSTSQIEERIRRRLGAASDG